MNKRIVLFALLAALLFGGCSQIFDGLIETVYKDQINNNEFGNSSIPVKILINDFSFTQAERQQGILKLALIPMFEVSGGYMMPNWGKRIDKEFDWGNLAYDSDSGSMALKTSIDVDRGFSYKAVVWQTRHGLDFIDQTDPARLLNFYFSNASGSNDTLGPENMNSKPYVAEPLNSGDRLPDWLWNQLFGSGGGTESFSLMTMSGTETYIDTVTANSGANYGYKVQRYGNDPKPVQAILVQRQLPNPGAPIPLYRNVEYASWYGNYWTMFPVYDAYSSYFDLNLPYDNLYRSDTATQFMLDQSIKLEVKLLYTDGSESGGQILDISFYSSGSSEIAAWTAFSIGVTVSNPAYANMPWIIRVYDENWNFVGDYNASIALDGSGYGNADLMSLRGAPFWSSMSGGKYNVYVVIDQYPDGFVGSGDYASSTYLTVYTSAGTFYDPSYGTVYSPQLVFDTGSYWWPW